MDLARDFKVALHRDAVAELERQKHEENQRADPCRVEARAAMFPANVHLHQKQKDGSQQQHAPRRRQLHQHRLEKRPTREEWPPPWFLFPADRVPIDVSRIQAVGRARLGLELSPELLDFEALGDARPEAADAIVPPDFRGSGSGSH